jgi:hypothetical protein
MGLLRNRSGHLRLNLMEEGLLEEAAAVAVKRIIAWQKKIKIELVPT